jgi:hypothetical protein
MGLPPRVGRRYSSGLESISNETGCDVPRLPDELIGSAFYLYPDRPSAEAGDDIGGTGSLVSIS